MASIKLKHSGGNGVIIAAPSSNPASDKTLTLPSDVDGTVVSKDSSNSLQNIAGINGGQLGNRNLIINGAMQVAQRGTSSTSSGYQTADRFNHGGGGWDAALTQAQVDVASGTTPYTSGFRKAFKITNGNQSSGLGSGDSFYIETSIEAQNLATSGWNYTSSSSYITISFWIKSSVAQNFYGYLKTQDGTSQRYPYETGALSADTWTKITKTIPGNSNITIDNNNGAGLYWEMIWLSGTDYTDSGVTLNQWGAFASGTRTPDSTATWFTTNAATLEITGVQLEVGSVATDFEHRSFGQELELCKRYCQVLSAGGNFTRFTLGYATGSSSVRWFNYLRPEMRSTPSFAHSGSFSCQPGSSFSISDVSLETASSSPQMAILLTDGNSGMSAGQAISLHANSDASAKITFSSEL